MRFKKLAVAPQKVHIIDLCKRCSAALSLVTVQIDRRWLQCGNFVGEILCRESILGHVKVDVVNS